MELACQGSVVAAAAAEEVAVPKAAAVAAAAARLPAGPGANRPERVTAVLALTAVADLHR